MLFPNNTMLRIFYFDIIVRMNFTFLLIFGIVLFATFTLIRRKMDIFFLITFAIGAAINANIYNTYYYPITLGSLTFGLNEFLYPLFVLTMVIRLIDYSKEEAKAMLISTLAAIMLSAFIQFFAEISTHYPYKEGRDLISVFIPLVLYTTSTLATLIAFIIVFKLYSKLKEMNKYLALVIIMVITNVVNGFIYSGVALLFYSVSDISYLLLDNFGSVVLGSLIIRTFAIGLSILSYFINNKIWKSENIILLEKNK